MLQFSNLTIETAVANCSGAMEADIILKNGRSSKCQMSRGNFSKTWTKGVIFVFLFVQLAIVTSCNKDEVIFQSEEAQILETEWWLPILQKHGLEPVAYNNFKNIFAMGKGGNSVNNGICTLKAATVLVKNRENYFFIEADSIYYNIEKGVFDFISGVGKIYKMDADLSQPSVVVKDLSKLTIVKEEGKEKYHYKGQPTVYY